LWAAGIDAATLERLTAANVARRFGLAGSKGAIASGMDADLLLLDPRRAQTLRAEDLLMRHPVSPYVGREFPVAVGAVWVRGALAWSQATGRGPARGQLVRPDLSHSVA
jgi:allantoinase